MHIVIQISTEYLQNCWRGMFLLMTFNQKYFGYIYIYFFNLIKITFKSDHDSPTE